MSRRGTWITQKFRIVLDVADAYGYGGVQRNSPIISASKIRSGHYWMHPRLQFFSTNSSNTSANNANEVKNNVNVKPPAPASPIFTFPYWLRWVLGSVLSFLLPFWKLGWQKLQRIEGEAEVVVEEVEKVANVVEKAAIVAEKVSEDAAEMLPEDGNLKKAALAVENASKLAAHDAQLTQEFVHKVEEIKNDVDDLEPFLEAVIDKIAKKESETK